MRRVLLNRFVLVPLVIAAVVAGWNVYVTLHAHGLVAGRVVDPAGRPVAGATVILYAHNFVTQVEKARTRSGEDGTFRFADNQSHLIQLQAEDGTERSARITVRLWFRAQDRQLLEPLRLGPMRDDGAMRGGRPMIHQARVSCFQVRPRAARPGPT